MKKILFVIPNNFDGIFLIGKGFIFDIIKLKNIYSSLSINLKLF